MREYKFRGMTLNGDWVYGNLSILLKNLTHVKAGIYISNSVGLPFAYQVRPDTVGQWTGQKDMHGTDIYEGDILVGEGYPYFDEGKRNYVAIVEWCFAGFHNVKYCVNHNKIGISDGINEPLEEGEYFEIIGNIHTNVEYVIIDK
jgi:hypothetical protein